MAELGSEYFIALVLWVATFVLLLAQAWGGQSSVVGLGLAYWVNLAMIHLIGGLIQMLPWHVTQERADSIAGFCLTAYALTGLLIGNMLVAPRLFPMLQPEKRRVRADLPTQRVAIRYVAIGLLVYFIVATLLGSVPSMSAVLSGGLPLAAGGFCLLWWHFWKTDQRRESWWVLGAALVVPVSTVLLKGFLSYGVFALAVLGCFVLVFYRPRIVMLGVGLVTTIAGLSLFSAYAKARSEIRGAVWGGSSMSERLDVTYNSVEENWSWFDASRRSHLTPIEDRLNQNYLVGAAFRNLNEERAEFARGETCIEALLALIPRIIWPDKPVWAGSGTLVTRFTGITFDRYTSVGIGHIMELYVNFGEAGIFLGYILLGLSIGLVDRMAGSHLHTGNVKAFILWLVLGQALLQAGGNFAEMTAAFAGYAVLCTVVNRFCLSGGQPQRRSMQRTQCSPPKPEQETSSCNLHPGEVSAGSTKFGETPTPPILK